MRKAALVALLYELDPAMGWAWRHEGPRSKERLINYILNVEYDRQ